MMTWLKLVGMIPPEAGSYWSAGTLEVWPADRSRLDWADGGRRAAFPITGNLAGGGTRWGSTNEAGDVYIPGADIGNSVNPPVLDITARLRDGVTGEWKEFRGTGRVQASAPGEWNINAPLGGALQYVMTPGVPAGALLQTDVGVAVPSMAAHNALRAETVTEYVRAGLLDPFTQPVDPNFQPVPLRGVGGTGWDDANHQWVCPRAGIYLITAAFQVLMRQVSQESYLAVYVNGQRYADVAKVTGVKVGAAEGGAGSCLAYIAAGMAVKLGVAAVEAPSEFVAGGERVYLSIARLGS